MSSVVSASRSRTSSARRKMALSSSSAAQPNTLADTDFAKGQAQRDAARKRQVAAYRKSKDGAEAEVVISSSTPD